MPDLIAKTVTQSRTNRTVALIVGVVLTKELSKYLPADIAQQIASTLSDEVVTGIVAALGGLAMYFRQKANPAPINQQGVVTARPK